MKIPNRLYKYRAFSDLSLSSLVEDKLFFADPSSFNDPLDTKPNLKVDLPDFQLEDILTRLIEQRVSGELEAAAKTVSYKGPKTQDHIVRQSQKQGQRSLEDIRYHAGNPDLEVDKPLSFLLGHAIENELLRRYDGGIFSLATRHSCPLMWSHYGDQHRGLAIGYSIPEDSRENLFKVRYGGESQVEASKILDMLDGNKTARREVDDSVLLKKAQDWRYEKEWRLIGQRGQQDSQIELEEVVFGMRCTMPVIYTVVRALENRRRTVRFYEIRRKPNTFLLKRYTLNFDEIAVSLPRRSLSVYEDFKDVVLE